MAKDRTGNFAAAIALQNDLNCGCVCGHSEINCVLTPTITHLWEWAHLAQRSLRNGIENFHDRQTTGNDIFRARGKVKMILSDRLDHDELRNNCQPWI